MASKQEVLNTLKALEREILGWLVKRDWDHVEEYLDYSISEGVEKLIQIVDHMTAGGTSETMLLSYWDAPNEDLQNIRQNVEWWLKAYRTLDNAMANGEPLDVVYERLLG